MMAYPGPPRRAGGLLRYVVLAVVIVSVLFYLRNSSLNAALSSVHSPIQVTPTHLPDVPIPQNPTKPDFEAPAKAASPEEPPAAPSEPAFQETPASPKGAAHPIDTLIESAEKTFQGLLGKESHDLKSAAAEYRKRRGRHPPPGFDEWFKFAQENKAVMVEDFFDQIYEDLSPFWGLPAATMRKEAWAYEMTINVRGHNATTGSDWFWTKIWLDMTKTIEHLLPDMDLALNAMDEPRIVVPWEEINKYMETERETRSMPPPSEVISEFQSLGPKPDPEVEVRNKDWEKTSESRGHPTFSSTNTIRTILEGCLSRMPPRESCTQSRCHGELRPHTRYFFKIHNTALV